MGISQSFAGTPTKQVAKGISGFELDRNMVSEPAALAKVTQTFVFGCTIGKSALQRANKLQENI